MRQARCRSRTHKGKTKKMKMQPEMFRQAQDNVSFLKNYRSRRKNSVYFNLSRRNRGTWGAKHWHSNWRFRMSRQTVNRWERILAATVLEMSSDFHNCHCDSLSRLTCGEALLLTYEVNGVRCDATNSIMLRHKAHVCEMSTNFSHVEGGREPESGSFHKIYCDLQRVPKHRTGAVMRAMVLKQIESVGARTWLNPPDLPRHVVWWMCGSDQGPDQEACDRLMDIDLYSRTSVFKVRTFYFQHQLN